jgi:hypothetical protein
MLENYTCETGEVKDEESFSLIKNDRGNRGIE